MITWGSTRRAAATAAVGGFAALTPVGTASAQTPFSGVAEVAVGATHASVDSDTFDFFGLDDSYTTILTSGAGAVAGPLAGAWGFQADVAIDAFFDAEEDSQSQLVFNQGHIFYRDANRFAAGGGLNTVSAYGDSGVDAYGANVEGDLYLNRYSASANLAFYDFDNFDSTAFGGQGALAFFPRDHIRFGGAVTYGRQDDISRFWRAELEAEVQRPGSPLSLTVAFANTQETIDEGFFGDGRVSTQSLRIGGRYYFSGLSLFDFDRRGASRDGGAFLLDAASGL